MNETKKTKTAPFSAKKVETLSPEGFIAPLVYSIQALLVRVEENGSYKIRWREDPYEFLDKNFGKIVEKYSELFPICDWDPQKIGKSTTSYKTALDAVKMIIAGIL